MKIETWPLTKIIPYHRNAKKHDVEAIARSIQEFKADQPIVVDGDGVIIKGHGRLKAAQQLGLKTFPVVVRTDLTTQQVRLARIADNTSNTSDYDLVLLTAELQEINLEMPDVELIDFGLENVEGLDLGWLIGKDKSGTGRDAEPQIDRAKELNKVWKVKTGDLWLIGEHRLLCGDSTKKEDVALVMAGEKAVLTFTDPPYGVSIGKKNVMLNSFQKIGRNIWLTIVRYLSVLPKVVGLG